ncbi:MAG: hypothetical protein ACXACR_02515 [Candidatus Hodarchaeales archaeon]
MKNKTASKIPKWEYAFGWSIIYLTIIIALIVVSIVIAYLWPIPIIY